MEKIRVHHRWRQVRPVLLALFVGFGVWGVFAYRTNVSSSRENHLCGVLAAIVQQSDKNAGTKFDPARDYYIEHPGALAITHIANAQILAELGCAPIKLVVKPSA